MTPRVVWAHAPASPVLNNRYLKLSLVGGGSVRIAYTVVYGDKPAAAIRQRADLDGNGVLDDHEVKVFSDALRAAIDQDLHLGVDGAPAKVEWEPPIPGITDFRVGPIPFSVDVVGRLPVPGPLTAPHLVTMDDETPIEQLGETEIKVEEGPGTRVLTAWRGREDQGRLLRFLWNGPKYSVLEDRSIGFRFVDEKAQKAAHRPRWPWAAGLGVLLLAVLGGVAWMRRRGPSRDGA